MSFTHSVEEAFALDMGSKEIDKIYEVLGKCEEELDALVIGSLLTNKMNAVKSLLGEIKKLLLWQFDPIVIITDEKKGSRYYFKLLKTRKAMIEKLIGRYERGEGFIGLNEHVDKGKCK